MGTSTSSAGPGSGVSLDPPWLDDVIDAIGSGSVIPPQDTPPNSPPQVGSLIAPPARFAGARRELKKFINSGNTSSLGKAIGHYSRTGMGGAQRAAARMRASTHAGVELVSFLNAVSTQSSAEARQWVDELLATSPSSDDVVDAIVRELAPPGGSTDEESLRDSIAQALSEMLVVDPNINLLNMVDGDTWTLLQLFLGNEVCSRLNFDVGQFFESAKLDPGMAVQREQEMRAFVKNEIGVALDLLRSSTPNPSKLQLEQLMQEALKLTFEVFEEEI